MPSGRTTKISTSSGAAAVADSARAAIRTREKGGGSSEMDFSFMLPSLSVIRSDAVCTPGGTTIGRRAIPAWSAVTGPIFAPATSASTVDPGRVSISIVSEPESGMESQRNSRSPSSSHWASTSATEGACSAGAVKRAFHCSPSCEGSPIEPTLVVSVTLAFAGARSVNSAAASLPSTSLAGWATNAAAARSAINAIARVSS